MLAAGAVLFLHFLMQQSVVLVGKCFISSCRLVMLLQGRHSVAALIARSLQSIGGIEGGRAYAFWSTR